MLYAQGITNLINSPDYKSQNEEDKKSSIGDFIFTYIAKLSSEADAPKITGMIIDLSEEDLVQSIKTLAGLKEKVEEGKSLLREED